MSQTKPWALTNPLAITNSIHFGNGSCGSTSTRFFQLTAKLPWVHTMFRGFSSTDKNNRNVPAIPLAKLVVAVDIHFPQGRAKLLHEWLNHRLRVFAQVATRPRVHRNFQRMGRGHSRVFRMSAHGFGFEYFWNGPACG